MNRPQSESDDKAEQVKHRQSIEDLSMLLEMPRDCVVAAYEQELDAMGRMARVRDYLPILVSRRVKNLLQSRRAFDVATGRSTAHQNEHFTEGRMHHGME